MYVHTMRISENLDGILLKSTKLKNKKTEDKHMGEVLIRM